MRYMHENMTRNTKNEFILCLVFLPVMPSSESNSDNVIRSSTHIKSSSIFTHFFYINFIYLHEEKRETCRESNAIWQLQSTMNDDIKYFPVMHFVLLTRVYVVHRLQETRELSWTWNHLSSMMLHSVVVFYPITLFLSFLSTAAASESDRHLLDEEVGNLYLIASLLVWIW